MLRSVGLEPSKLSPRVKLHFIARLAPLVEPNFNFIELGPRGTGKSYFFSEFSPYSTLISGGQATKSVLFYNNARHKIGLVGFWDTVAFDEVGGIKVKDAELGRHLGGDTLGGAVEWAQPGAPDFEDVEFEGAAAARAASVPVALFFTVAGSPLA